MGAKIHVLLMPALASFRRRFLCGVKAVVVLVILFAFVGCERKVSDPEMGAVRNWIEQESTKLELIPNKKLVPREDWLVKRGPEPEIFLFYAPHQENRQKGYLVISGLRKQGDVLEISKEEYDDLGEPADKEALHKIWMERRILKKMSLAE
ncbi:MAG: hypothetical protein AAF514_08820 [Verrucomicrobiota bacterium]